MKFLKTLKILCDICFYLTFANLVTSLFGGASAIFTLPIFAFSIFLASMLSANVVFKYAPLILMGVCFYFIPLNLVNMFLLIPIFIYVVYSIATINKPIMQLDCSYQFKLFIKVFLCFLVLPLMMGASYLLREFVTPYAIIFMVLSVILMRMLRHDDIIYSENRFKLINILSAVGAVGLMMFLASNVFVQFVKMLYLQGFVTGFVFLITSFLKFISRGFDRLKTNEIEEKSVALGDDGMRQAERVLDVELSTELYQPSLFQTFFNYFVVAVIITLLIVIIVKMFKSEKYQQLAPVKGVKEIRKRLMAGKKQTKHNNDNPIREIYRKFLKYYLKNDLIIETFTTSIDVEKKAYERFKKTETNALRDIYVKVRYGEKGYTKKDVKKAKDLLDEIKRI